MERLFYMVTCRDIVNQGNFALIVLDYVRFDFDEVERAMEELVALGISGLGISVIDDREDIREKLLKRADELELPFFYVRWKGASFVDISQSVGNLITDTCF